MKTHILTLMLVPIVLACNNHKKSAKSAREPSYYAKKKIPVPSGKSAAADEFTCINKPSGMDYNVTPKYEETEEDKRIQALINRGNYQSNSSTGTNIQGAVGPGAGSSYSSSYYGANAKKQEIEACTNDGSVIKVVKPAGQNNKDNVESVEFSEESSLFTDTTSTNSSNKEYSFDNEEIEYEEPADTTNTPIW